MACLTTCTDCGDYKPARGFTICHPCIAAKFKAAEENAQRAADITTALGHERERLASAMIERAEMVEDKARATDGPQRALLYNEGAVLRDRAAWMRRGGVA